jgi:broad-specificity NMP kinase
MEEIFQQVFEKQKSEIGDFDYENKPLIITYLGTPGSGKSQISTLLQEKLNCLVIRSDRTQLDLEDIRNEKYYKGYIDEKRQYIYWAVEQIHNKAKNQTIILDKSIDRTYEDTLSLAHKLGYRLVVVIALDCSEEELIKRYHDRHGHHANDYIKNLERWIKDYENAKKNYKYDLIFNTEEKSLENITNEIEEYINSLQ